MSVRGQACARVWVYMASNGSWESLTIITASMVFAAIGGGWTCWVRSWCTGDSTCVSTSSSSFSAVQCSFRTNVPLVSDLLYHNHSVGSLEALTRGVCGVGERLHLSAVTGKSTCMLLRPYPDALDAEVMRPDASTDHERACGAWMSSGLAMTPSVVQNVEYFSFADTSERAAAVQTAEAAMHAGSRLSSGNLGKFRAACQRVVLGGSAAVRAAGQLAYEYLNAQASIDAVSDEDSMLQSVGMLMGHYCDAPVRFGWEMQHSGYRTSVRRGTSFPAYAMAEALQLVNVGSAIQARAESGNEHVRTHALSSPVASMEQLTQVLRGATGRTDDGAAGLYAISYTPELDGLVHLFNTTEDINRVRAYLKGVAALCAFSLQALVDNPGYTVRSGAPEDWLRAQAREHPPAAALGQLKPPVNHAPLFEVENITVLNASSITLSQLVGAPAGDPDTACRDFTRMMFPDEIDQIHHELVISPTLYDRMESITAQVRAGVAHVLRTDARIRAAMLDPDAIAVDVENTRIRIPGSPRGTWAGSTRALPIAALDSSDGVFIMAAKQARTLYLDRQGSLAYDATSPCEGPAGMWPLTSNAYIFPSYTCSYYLLGMSFVPYADELYDDASLVSRFGYIIAHELSHNNLNTPYVTPGITDLLENYPCASTRNEGIADILGIMGVLQTGLINSTLLCQHVSQAWCARVPVGYGGCMGQSHPLPNTRGDIMCETMRTMGL